MPNLLRMLRDAYYNLLVNEPAFLKYMDIFKPLGLSKAKMMARIYENLSLTLHMELSSMLNELSSKEASDVCDSLATRMLAKFAVSPHQLFKEEPLLDQHVQPPAPTLKLG